MNLVLFMFLTSFGAVQAVSNYKFLKIENCSSAAESPLMIENCVVAGTKVNVSIIFNRPVDKIGIHVALYNVVNSEAHQIFKMPRVDWCDLMKGKNAKGMMKVVFDAIKDSIPELIQQCPYEGPYQVINGMIATKSLFIFPSGTFRVDLKVYVDDKFVVKPIVTLELFD